MQRIWVVGMMACLVWFLNSCARPGVYGGRTESGWVVTPDLKLSGKVVSVNPVGRFVVLRFMGGRLPVLGQELSVYRREMKVGEVKVSGPQRDEHIVADIVTGELQVGDEVRVP
ncbi:MAG: hypothetical protein RMN51_12225 [Verrucomicrobiota bacterium]|nr:hypothetical protein [Limisphaera sp.]MDW8382858.1 hypothetical protein [Verrucomicrobiota bacterium]